MLLSTNEGHIYSDPASIEPSQSSRKFFVLNNNHLLPTLQIMSSPCCLEDGRAGRTIKTQLIVRHTGLQEKKEWVLKAYLDREQLVCYYLFITCH